MVSHWKPLEEKHWNIKRIGFIFQPQLLANVNYASYGENWILSFNTTFLNILRHFKCFSNVLSHCLMIKILQQMLNMDCKWPKLAFCSEIPPFYSFERWSKYLQLGKRWKIDKLVLQFNGCFALQVFEPVTWLKAIHTYGANDLFWK